MSQHLPSGTELMGYRLIRVLGEGGFGVTYLAEDAIGIKLAIKEYLPAEYAVRGSDSQVIARSDSASTTFAWGLERFEQEATRLVRFRGHANIVRVERFFKANGTAYLAMAYEDGNSLGDLVKTGGPLPPARLAVVVEGLLAGLAAVHGEGMLHRDVKPDNLYLRADGTPVLLDFGAAREALSRHSRTLTGLITDGYSPLEQYSPEDKDHGPWSDLYAAAATIFFAMTGNSPPPSPQRAMRDTMRPVGELVGHRYPPRLLQAVEASLALRPEARPQTVAAFRQMLDGIMPAVAEAATRRVEAAPLPPQPQPQPEPPPEPRELPSSVWRFVIGAVLLGVIAAIVVPRLGQRPPPMDVSKILPGDGFRECPVCPEMIVIPDGSFTMGASAAEVAYARRMGWGGADDEVPRRRVTIAAAFAIGRDEITIEQYRLHLKNAGRNPEGCFDGNGRNVKPGGWLTRGDSYVDSSPAACVSRDDARDYARWLNKRVFGTEDGPYRLPSEAEWEYAARAGSTTQFPWGDDLGHGKAHCRGCGPIITRNGTTEPTMAGQYPPNAFGLHDMIGNLDELVEDCDTPNHVGAPIDGRAVTGRPDCGAVIRGGNFTGDAFSMRSASRTALGGHDRYDFVGFRVVRDLAWRPR